MKKIVLSTLTAAVLSAAALSAQAQNVAVVNGKPVPTARLEALRAQLQERMGREIPAEMDAELKEELITREIFMQEAVRLGLDKTASYRKNMELARETVLIRELFVDFQKKNPITEADIKKEYDRFVAANQGQEYRASHILVDSEERARAIVAEVKAGKKFEDIAKAESKDPGSGARGGDLGWAAPAKYVPEFSQAMVALKKGELSEVVKSDFGWHVIRLDDTREAKLPALEEIREGIVQELEQDKMREFQENLRKKAKVQ